MNRHEEIRYLNSLSVKEVVEKAGSHLVVKKNGSEIDSYMAEKMLSLIEDNNRLARPTAAIFPFGPVGQYPLMAAEINNKGISLKKTIMFFMDEYANDSGEEIPEEHPLSFRGKFRKIFSKIDPALAPEPENIIFPDSENISNLHHKIREAEPIQVCYGGIGIHGHLAFNEPGEGVRFSDPRLIDINAYTVTINAIRENIGGNIVNFPKKALTLGMNQILNAEEIILACRNGNLGIDWANTALRLALLGVPGDDFPVTYLREVEKYTIITDEETLAVPRYII